jgi:hypothetical protein
LEELITQSQNFYGEKKERDTKLNNIVFCLKLGMDCDPDIRSAKDWQHKDRTFLEMLLDRDWGEENTLQLLSLKTNWQTTEKSDELIQGKEHSKKVKEMYQVMKEKNALEQSFENISIDLAKKIKI